MLKVSGSMFRSRFRMNRKVLGDEVHSHGSLRAVKKKRGLGLFGRIVAPVVSALVIFVSMGAIGAYAQGSTAPSVVTRAQFVYSLDVANNLQPVYPSSPTFTDVQPSSPYYGYIEAAYQAGWIVGVGNNLFDPNGSLTRAQVAKIEVLAIGDGKAALADMSTPTSFTDNQEIPSWALGYVDEAVAIGLVKGYPNGTFVPNGTLTTSDESYFLAQYTATESHVAFSISATPASASVGQPVALSSTGTTQSVSYNVNSTTAVISGNKFIASAPGTYTVTGTTSGGATSTTTVVVYGVASALKINAPSTVVANGSTKTSVTVDVVDANGNTVANSSDTITLSSSNNATAGVEGSNGTVVVAATAVSATAVNGVATFTVQSGSVAGTETFLTATDTASPSLPKQTFTMSSVAQVATSISLTAPKYIDANSATTGTVVATVDDQTGSPMLSGSGTFGISLSISGAGAFSSGTSPQTLAYANGTPASFTFTSIQGDTGTISFTATSAGMTAGTATTDAVIVGSPVALVVTPTNGNTSFSDGVATTVGNSVEFTVSSVDSNGYPTATPSSVVVKITKETGSGTLGVSATQTGTYSSATSGVSVTLGSSGTFFVGDTTTGSGNADAGTYLMSVSSLSPSGLASPSAVSITETASAPTNISLNPVSIQVGVSSPTTTISAQITDANGNPVADSGSPITFSATSTAGEFTLGQTASTTSSPYTVSSVVETTGQNGNASVSFVGQPYIGAYTITATSTGLTADSTSTINIENTVASSVSIALLNTATGSSSYATAGQSVTATVYAYDQYGTVIPNTQVQNITITPNNNGLVCGAVVANTNGSYTSTCTAETSGSVNVVAVDNSTPSIPSATASMSVSAGAPVGYEFISQSGVNVGNYVGGIASGGTKEISGYTGLSNSTPLSVSANTPVELTIVPIDAYGNQTALSSSETLNLQNLESPAGNFQATNGGSIITTTTLPAGTSSFSVWYVNSTSGAYLLNGDAY